MAEWSRGELDRIGEAEELEIAPRRGDGTIRKPIPIWVVRARNDIYVRSVNGRKSAWFRTALARHEGQIRAGGVEKDVILEEAGDEVNDEVDSVYRSKYSRYAASIVNSIVSPQAAAATMKLMPRL